MRSWTRAGMLAGSVALAALLGTTPPGVAAGGPEPVVVRMSDPAGDLDVKASVPAKVGRSVDIRHVRLRVVRGERVKVTLRIADARAYRRFDQYIGLSLDPVGRGESSVVSARADGPVEIYTKVGDVVCERGRVGVDTAADTLTLVLPPECLASDRRGRATVMAFTELRRGPRAIVGYDTSDRSRVLRLR